MKTREFRKQQIEEIARNNGGIIRTADLRSLNIDSRGIERLQRNHIIEKIMNGQFILSDEEISKEELVSRLFPDGVLTMGFAFYHYGYSKLVPLEYEIAIDKNASKTRFEIEYPFVKPYYLEPSMLEFGVQTEKIGKAGMKMFDRDRLICECLNYEYKMSDYAYREIISSYINDPKKNIDNLLEYARKRNVIKKAEKVAGKCH